jgi:hypothetical protein
LSADFGVLVRAAAGAPVPPEIGCWWNSTAVHPPKEPAPAGAGHSSSHGAPAEGGGPPGPLDPLELNLAGVVPISPVAVVDSAVGEKVVPGTSAPIDLALCLEIVKRVQWGGDRRRGVARIELAGGGVIVVSGEGREVTLDVALPDGAASDVFSKLAERLEARGIAVRELTLR